METKSWRTDRQMESNALHFSLTWSIMKGTGTCRMDISHISDWCVVLDSGWCLIISSFVFISEATIESSIRCSLHWFSDASFTRWTKAYNRQKLTLLYYTLITWYCVSMPYDVTNSTNAKLLCNTFSCSFHYCLTWLKYHGYTNAKSHVAQKWGVLEGTVIMNNDVLQNNSRYYFEWIFWVRQSWEGRVTLPHTKRCTGKKALGLLMQKV